MNKTDNLFEKWSEKERARTAVAATTATEEFTQSSQVPSSTYPGTTYPVRATPSLQYIYIYIVVFCNMLSFRLC